MNNPTEREALREQVAEIVHAARLAPGGAMTQWAVALEFTDRILALAAPAPREQSEAVDDLGLGTDEDPSDDEGVRCTCEWQSPNTGEVHARWPAETDWRCRVHGRPEAESEAWPEGAPREQEPPAPRFCCPTCGKQFDSFRLDDRSRRHCPHCGVHLTPGLASRRPDYSESIRRAVAAELNLSGGSARMDENEWDTAASAETVDFEPPAPGEGLDEDALWWRSEWYKLSAAFDALKAERAAPTAEAARLGDVERQIELAQNYLAMDKTPNDAITGAEFHLAVAARLLRGERSTTEDR